MADTTSVGTIQLDVEINPQSLNAELSKLSKVFNSNFKNMFSGTMSQTNNFVKDSIGRIANSFKNFTQSGVGSSEKVSKSVSKMNAEYEKTETKIAEMRKELAKLFAEQDEIARGYQGFPAFSGMTKEASMEQMLKSDTGYQKLSAEIDKLIAKLDPLVEKNKKLADEIKNVGDKAENAGNKFNFMGGTVRSVSSMVKGMVGRLGKLGSAIKKVTMSMFKLNGAKRIFSRETSRANSVTSSFNNALNRMSRTIVRNLIVYGLIIKGLKSMISYMWSALKTNQQFANSLNIIRTNLYVAFQPIYDFILPALNALMNAVATVTTFIASAISAMFGKSYKQSYNAAKKMNKQIQDIGGSTTGAGKAAKKAGKEAKGALAGFDEINKLDIPKDDGGSGGAPGAGGGGAGGFEMVMPPESMFDAFDDLLGDPYAIGKKVAEWITKGLSSINWENIKKHASNIGKNIALFINGGIDTPKLWHQMGMTIGEGLNTVATFAESFADTLNWSGLGKSLANGLNSAVNYWDPNLTGRAIYKSLNGIREVIYNFFTNTDWGSFGEKFADGLNTIVTGLDMDMIGRSFASKWNALTDFMHEFISEFDWTTLGSQLSVGINSWFDEIDWAKLGTTLSNGVKGVLDTVNAFVIGTDWFQIGQSLADIIKSIDWSGIISMMFKGIGAALAGLAQFIWGLISDAWQSVIDWWKDTAYKDGEFTIKGLLEGILEGFKNIGKWIKDNIFQPFIDGFKSVFGIHSPSTVMKEMGNSLMQGLMNGIKELVDKVIKIFTDIKDKISKVWDSVKTKTSEIWNAIKTFLIGKIWNPIKSIAETTWNGIKKVILDPINQAWTSLKEIWDKIKKYILDKWNEIKQGISSMKNALVNAVLEPFKIVDGKIKGIIGNARDWGRNLIGNFIDGIKAMTGKVKEAATNVANAVKDRLGFSSPTKEGPGSDADKWMPNMMEMFAAGIEDNIAQVSAAINMTAGAIQQGVEPNTDDVAASIGNAVSQSMQGIDIGGGDMTLIIKIGEDTITDKIVSNINRKNRISGETVIQV